MCAQFSSAYESWTDRARRAIAFAEDAARQSQCPQLEPGHVLLGLLSTDNGVGTAVLQALSVNLETARLQLERLVSTGVCETHPGVLPRGPGAQQVYALAKEQASLLQHNYIGTEHLLLGLLGVQDAVVKQIFKANNLTVDCVRDKIVELLGTGDDGIKLAPDPYE